MLRRSAAFAGLLSLTACPSPDPQGKFDGFLDDTKEERDEFASIKMDMGGMLADVNGDFLFAIETNIAPGLYLQFIATTTLELEGAGGTATITLQPLALDVMDNLNPRTPVGDPIVIENIEVSAAGSFRVESLGEVMVTGMANPITGSDIVAELGLEGFIQNDNLYCGTVFGTIISPLAGVSLEGSTFGAERVESTDPASLPTDIIFKCPEPGGGDDTGGSTGDSGGSTDGTTGGTDGGTTGGTDGGTTGGTDSGSDSGSGSGSGSSGG